MELVNVAVVVD